MGIFFSCSTDVESDMGPYTVLAKGKTCDSVTEPMRGKKLTYCELASATKKFKNLIGEGTFGVVYKGRLTSGELVAVKQLKQDMGDVDVEALTFRHPNLVTVRDYCIVGDQRFLVSEYVPMGSLKDRLFDLKPGQEPLDWDTRKKIIVGVARGIEYLHNKNFAYTDIRASNILLDKDFDPKLSEFELKYKQAPRIFHMRPPEYAMTGRLTTMSDIHSFGQILLELLTGRKALDLTRKPGEEVLVKWCRPFLTEGKVNTRWWLSQAVDPHIKGRIPVLTLRRMVILMAMCLREWPSHRPSISFILEALIVFFM